jgi:hypothetical protein
VRRLEIPEGPRLIARNAILDISSMPPSQFVQIAGEPYCISADAWDFSEYHAAAAAAVQEDSKLNKLTYACVPRRLSESDFWRLVCPTYGLSSTLLRLMQANAGGSRHATPRTYRSFLSATKNRPWPPAHLCRSHLLLKPPSSLT